MHIIRALSILLFVIFVSACNSRVGVESVVHYTPVGKPNVPNRHINAQGFYDTIRAHPDWDGEFHQQDAVAWEKHFKREYGSQSS